MRGSCTQVSTGRTIIPMWTRRGRGQTMALVILGFKNWCWQSEVWKPGSKGDMGRAEIRTVTSISQLRILRSERGKVIP